MDDNNTFPLFKGPNTPGLYFDESPASTETNQTRPNLASSASSFVSTSTYSSNVSYSSIPTIVNAQPCHEITKEMIYTDLATTTFLGRKPGQLNLVINATPDVDAGCFVPGSASFTLHQLASDSFSTSSNDGSKSFRVTTSQLDYNNKRIMPHISYSRSNLYFNNFNEYGKAVKFHIETKGYGRLKNIETALDISCGIAHLKFKKGEIYFTLTHMLSSKLLQENEPSGVPPHLFDALKTVLRTAERIRKRGEESGIHYLLNQEEDKYWDIINSVGRKSVTRLDMSRLSDTSKSEFKFKKDRGFEMSFEIEGYSKFILEEVVCGEREFHATSRPYHYRNSTGDEAHIVTSTITGFHDIMLINKVKPDVVMEDTIGNGYTITFSPLPIVVTFSPPAPFPLPIVQ